MSDDHQLQVEIGNYRIVREIDSGAFGRVYLATNGRGIQTVDVAPLGLSF